MTGVLPKNVNKIKTIVINHKMFASSFDSY